MHVHVTHMLLYGLKREADGFNSQSDDTAPLDCDVISR